MHTYIHKHIILTSVVTLQKISVWLSFESHLNIVPVSLGSSISIILFSFYNGIIII